MRLAWPLFQGTTRRGEPMRYRTIDVHGLDVFYREAGRPGAPNLLLLHGFPSSSHMFRDLIPLLADRFHTFAPDLPGFGRTAMPPRDKFEYTFDNLARVVDRFTELVGLDGSPSTSSTTGPRRATASRCGTRSGSPRSSPRTAMPTRRA